MKYKIELFVTKSWVFRAKVTPHDREIPPFEVSVGGKNWQHIESALKRQILGKCKQLLKKLENDVWLDK